MSFLLIHNKGRFSRPEKAKTVDFKVGSLCKYFIDKYGISENVAIT